MSNITARDMTLAAIFAALTAVAAMLVRYGGSVVPFSLVPFVAMLAGGILGARLGALSMIIYILIGLAGIPVFAKPPFGGPAYVLQPTFGFLPGFAAGAYVIGSLLKDRAKAGIMRYIFSMVAGLAVFYLVGLPYLYLILRFYLGQSISLGKLLAIGFTPFILLDLVKAVAAAFLARSVCRRLSLISPGTGEVKN